MFVEIFETKNGKEKILILTPVSNTHDQKIIDDIAKTGAYVIIKYDPNFNNSKIMEIGIPLTVK